ncbi:type II secretion system protein [uncultured Amnibacterium sp.]|uniref:type II secretion system protein n=1 Tax=uncultured Amnibacterium sp. TaxID=1631851 RepID=UPI0035CB6522
MSITTALKARREQLRDREAGFTLIELLVVVIIIGILAAIAIPVYLGVQNSAKDASATNDLANAKVAINAAYSAKNSWTDLSTTAATNTTAFKDYGWTTPTDTTLSGPVDASNPAKGSSTSWCLKEVSGSGKSVYITQATAAVVAPATLPTGCQ